MCRWQEAMTAALYGPDGFFVRAGARPADHFRTSALASPQFAGAVLELLRRTDQALGEPDPLDVVDVGAGGGELLSALYAAAPRPLAERLRATAVELAPPVAPAGQLTWRQTPPTRVRGLVVATEWLDNIPVDIAEVDPAGRVRYVLVDPATGREAPGDPVTGRDADWLARWWPVGVPGARAEIGRARDAAWAEVVGTLVAGGALTVDYGHTAAARPPLGTLTGSRHGREVPPVPDGSVDLTAHVAVDAVAAAGRRGGYPGPPYPEPTVVAQREALRELGLDGARPPLALARRDPATYLRRLSAATGAAELTDPAGLGGHLWLWQPVDARLPGLPTASP